MPTPNLERAERIWQEINRDFLTTEQFSKLIGTLADSVRSAKDEFRTKNDQNTLEYLRRYTAVTDLLDKTVAELDATIDKKADARDVRDQLERIRTDAQNKIDQLWSKIPTVPDLAPLELELARIKNAMPAAVDGKGLWKALNEVNDELQATKAEMTKLRDNYAPGIRVFGGARGFQLLVDGKKKGQVNYLNLVPGEGVSIDYSTAHGRNDIIITANGGGEGGGGLSVLLPTAGDVDDANKSFTFASEPQLVVVNGASYRDGHGCTITGTSVTLDDPIGTGGDIYGLG